MKRFYVKLFIILLFFVEIFTLGSLKAQTLRKEIFAQRRHELMDKMVNGIAIFRSARIANRNSDVDYEYRQDSDFYYLAGFEEPEAAFLLIPDADKKFIMFVRPRNPIMETWTGKRYGIKGAMHVFGADTAYVTDKFEEILSGYLRGENKVYCSFHDHELNEKLFRMISNPRGNWPKEIIDPEQFVSEMRLIKSPEEIEIMRKAINITCDAHIEAMKAIKPGMNEYEIEAIIEYVYKKNGSPRPGFPSIVGSGPNSTILHYVANNQQIHNGDLILIDIGAEYGYYTADVTRTFPVNGKFSREQREIYEIVLKAQQETIKMVTPGVGIDEIQDHTIKVLSAGLYRLGLITHEDIKWQQRVWHIHGTSHWLGLDVHDVGDYRHADEKGRILETGMVFTVEPGIYIRENIFDILPEILRNSVPKEEITDFINKVKPVVEKYAKIGVRIEDDVLVTKNGYEILSAKAPKTIYEIEKMMKNKSYLNR